MTQTLTNPEGGTAEVGEKPKGGRPAKYDAPPTYDALTPVDKQIVDYFAMDGLLPQNGEWLDAVTQKPRKGRMIQVGTQEFAESIGYADRKSLYNRQAAIPNFDELVLARMPALYRRYMVPAAWKGLGLRSMRGDAKQAEMLLSHYSNFVPPTQKHEIKIDGLAEAVNAARMARRDRDRADVTPPEEGVIVEAPKVANSIPLPTVNPQPGDKGGVQTAPTPVAITPEPQAQPLQNSGNGGVVEHETPPIVPAPGAESKPTPDLVDIQSPNVNQKVDSVDIQPSPATPPLPEMPDDSGLDEFGDPIGPIREFD